MAALSQLSYSPKPVVLGSVYPSGYMASEREKRERISSPRRDELRHVEVVSGVVTTYAASR
jgi:hypothetical protein